MKTWFDDDFDSMDWEDCQLFSISLPFWESGNKLCLDINYLDNELNSSQEMPIEIPALISFEGVTNLKFNINYLNKLNLEIYSISRSGKKTYPDTNYYERDYTISFLNNGEITFCATKFQQQSVKIENLKINNKGPRGLFDYLN